METLKNNEVQLIACCGLYCAECSKYKKGKCPGCKENNKATWCKIRSCCLEKEIANCSECEEYIDPKDCPKYDNFISRVIEFFSATDRSLCIEYLRKNSSDQFVKMMREMEQMSLPKDRREARK